MENSPAIEKLEQIQNLTADASKKYKEAITLLDQAFELTLTMSATEDTSQFMGRGAGTHRKQLIRQLALLLEEEETRKTDQRISDIKREARFTLIFFRMLDKAN